MTMRRPAGAPDSVDGGDSLADVVERLFARFDRQLSLPTIVRVVRRCRRELDIAPAAAGPGVLERLAHQRLLGLVAAQAVRA